MSAWAVALALTLSACIITTDAEESVEVAVTEPPKIDEPISNFLRSAAERSQSANDYQAATGYYQNLQERDPSDIDAAIGLARNLRLSGQSGEAVRMLTASLQQNSSRLDLKAELGKAQLAAGLSREAIATLSDVVTRAPSDWRALSALGIAHDVTGDPVKAQKRYNAALVVSPDAVSVLNNLALSMTLSGNLAGGITTLERAARLRGSGVQVRQNLALLYAMICHEGRPRRCRAVAEARPIDRDRAAQPSLLPADQSDDRRGILVVLDGDDQWRDQRPAACAGDNVAAALGADRDDGARRHRETGN